MSQSATPRAIVDRQLSAYNARDLQVYCALFADDAVISRLNTGEEIARGHDAIRAHYLARFSNSRLHCTVKARIEIGEYVVDHEHVTGMSEDALEVLAIYKVRDALIRSVQFIWP